VKPTACTITAQENLLPRRPIQHVVGAKAVAAVSSIWLDAGAAVEEVRNDYGEDLLIQTALNGELDPSKIWIQVKGRSRVEAGADKAVIKVPIGHALRWTYSADVVVVVLWDVEANRGWYTHPRMQADPIELVLSGKSSVSLHFRAEQGFDTAAAEEIARSTRMEHCNGHYLAADAMSKTITKLSSDKSAKQMKNIADYAVFDLLRKVGFITNSGISKEAIRNLRNGYRDLWEKSLTPINGSSWPYNSL
jgi:hypothetical protein